MKQVFTPKKMRPSAQTISFIKQIAYSYHTMVQNGKLKAVSYTHLLLSPSTWKEEMKSLILFEMASLHSSP